MKVLGTVLGLGGGIVSVVCSVAFSHDPSKFEKCSSISLGAPRVLLALTVRVGLGALSELYPGLRGM